MRFTKHIMKSLCTAAFTIAILIFSGCTKESDDVITIGEEPRFEDMSYGPLKMSLSIDPPKVELQKDILLIVKITHPSEIRLSMPKITDRLKGFHISGTYDQEPIIENGSTTIESHFLLTPVISDEYRIAPIPVIFEDMSTSPAKQKWFPTRPIRLDFIPPFEENAPGDIDVEIKPVWIHPTFKTVALWVAAGLLGIGVIWLLWRLSKRVHEEIKIRRMSPKERALKELAMLVAKHLPEKNMVKEFYLELTMIVRRYIERNHKIKAPEQTTEEFLAAVTKDKRFSETAIQTLKEFLEAADLVKFAAYCPDKSSIDSATSTAKNYIVSDDAQSNGGEI